jgi:hypothetical protein
MKTKGKNKKGAGRPIIENRRNPITVMITENEKEAIKALSKDLGLSLSSTMKYLLASGFLFNMGYLKTKGGYISAELLINDYKYSPPQKEHIFRRAWDYWGIEDPNNSVDN